YLFLPIRAGKSPAINWGNPDTIIKLLRHFIRAEYEPFSHIYSFKKISIQFINYLKVLKEQYHIILWLCVPIGWFGAWKTKQKLVIASITLFISTTLGFMILINYEPNPLNFYLAEVYFIPSYIIFLYWILEGLIFISDKINKPYLNEFLACIVLITGFFILNKNYFYNNSRGNMAAYHYGEDLLFTLPPNTYLITKGDNQLFSLFYLKLVENRRKDLKIDPGTKKYIFNDQDVSPGMDNFFFSEKQDAILIGNTGIIPYGLVYTYASPQKIVKAKSEFWDYYKNRNMEQKEYYKDYLLSDLLVKYQLQHGENFYANGKKEEAYKEYKKALLEGADIYESYFEFAMKLFSKNRFNDAIFEFEKIILLYPERAQTYNYLGVANAQMEKFSEALKYLEIAVEKAPENSNYFYNLALTYFKNGEPAKTQKTLEQALKINPGDEKIRELMKFIAK
ncbi:tetratricopeptide repeat protein, partial [Candidatus Desantisbacteria bacterium]|nr:tetratricopeptide repeat protein [Candidatus Desantisbacteria bacterium]